jgi:hypothetical protein
MKHEHVIMNMKIKEGNCASAKNQGVRITSAKNKGSANYKHKNQGARKRLFKRAKFKDSPKNVEYTDGQNVYRQTSTDKMSTDKILTDKTSTDKTSTDKTSMDKHRLGQNVQK